MAYMQKLILNEKQRAVVGEVLIALQNIEADKKATQDKRHTDDTNARLKQGIDGQAWRALQTIKTAHMVEVLSETQRETLVLTSLRVIQDGAKLDEVWAGVFTRFECREEGASPSPIKTASGKIVEPDKFYLVSERSHPMEDAFSYDVALGSEIIASKRGDKNSRIIDQVIKEHRGQIPHRYCKQRGVCTHGREIAQQDGLKEASA